MITRLKNDRLSQIMLGAIAVAGIFACFTVSAFLLIITSRAKEPVVPVTISPTPTVTLLQFDGNSDKIISFEIDQSGPVRFGFVHRDDGNFFVYLSQADGKLLASLANKSGQYTGEVSERLDAGQYNLEITASGSWTVIILLPQ